MITTVVFFVQLSGAARTPNLVETLFWCCFQPFLLISNIFQWFSGWNQEKKIEKRLKKNSVLSYSFKLVDMQTLVDLLRRYLKFVFFWLILFIKGKQKTNSSLSNHVHNSPLYLVFSNHTSVWTSTTLHSPFNWS